MLVQEKHGGVPRLSIKVGSPSSSFKLSEMFRKSHQSSLFVELYDKRRSGRATRRYCGELYHCEDTDPVHFLTAAALTPTMDVSIGLYHLLHARVNGESVVQCNVCKAVMANADNQMRKHFVQIHNLSAGTYDAAIRGWKAWSYDTPLHIAVQTEAEADMLKLALNLPDAKVTNRM